MMDQDDTQADAPKGRKRTSKKRGGKRTSSAKKSSTHDDKIEDAPAPKPRTRSSASSSETMNRMLINYVPGEECRVAVVCNDKLDEFHAERANSVSIVGNIYVGRVMNVERSIQAAFIDFGTGSNGFLHISDLHPKYFPGESDDTTERIGKKTPRRERPPIEKCLKRGQKILVQVLKEGISTKGPTLTSYLSLPGRYLVMLPDMDKVGVSRKVEDDDERRAMRKVLDTLDLPKEFGFILRTAGMNKTKTDIKRDLAYLQRLWKDIEKRLGQGEKPRLLYAESDLLMRALRDIWTSEINEIVVDDPVALRRAWGFMRIVSPRSSTRLLEYDRRVPIFHAFNVEEQVERIHLREVPLPSGGSLVFDEAEALIAIDVNSGKSRSHGDAEATAYQTNIQAIEEICRQLKLRDAGGLVMMDLIDMMKRSNRHDIEDRLHELLKRDRAATKPLPISQFGIIEMTRQRVRGSMKSLHFVRSTEGDGRGWVRRPESVATAAIRDVAALLGHEQVHKVEMVVSSHVAGEMLSSKRVAITKLELVTRKRIDVRVSESIGVDRVAMYAYDSAGADLEMDKLPRFVPPTDLEEFSHVAPRKAEDWAADTTAEPELVLEQLVDDEARQRLDAIKAAEDELKEAEAALNAEFDDDGNIRERDDDDRKRGRRRRRRGGRGGASGGNTEAELRDERSETQDNSAATQDDQDSQNGDAPRRGKRRRRGRRGSGAGAPEATDAPAASTGNASEAHINSEIDALRRDREEQYGPVAPSGFPWRGDSWDIEPSALTMTSFDDDFADKVRQGLPAEAPASLRDAKRSGTTPRKNGRTRDEHSNDDDRNSQGRRGGGRNERESDRNRTSRDDSSRRDNRAPREEKRSAPEPVAVTEAPTEPTKVKSSSAATTAKRIAPADILGGAGMKRAGSGTAAPSKAPPKRSTSNRAAAKSVRKRNDTDSPVMIKPARGVAPRMKS